MKPSLHFPLVCAPFLFAPIAHAADYFVSSSAPDAADTNPGTEALPWKTIARVNTATLAAGDTIHFRSGDLWREKLTPPKSGTAAKRVTFTFYGEGAKPVISGAEVITTGWAPFEGGTPGTYCLPIATQVKMVTKDSAYIKWNKTFTALAANQYGWENGMLYLNIGTSPEGIPIEIGQRDHGISGAINRDYVTIRGLRIEKSNNSLLRLDRSEFWRIENCEIYYGNSDSSTAGGGISGDRMHDVVIAGNHINYSLGDGVIAWRSARVEINGNRIENIYDEGGASGSDCIQVGAKSSTPNACDGFKIINNYVTRHATDTQKGCIIQEMGDNGILSGNTCIKGMFGLSSSGNNNIIEHNYVTGFGVGGGIRISQDTDMYGMKIRYNVVTQSPGFAGITIINDKRDAPPRKRSNFEIYNNVVYNTYYGIGSSQPFSGTIRNNIVWSPSSNPRMRISTGTLIEGEAVTVSHNIIKDATTETMAAIAGERYYNLAELQAGGWGEGSMISDPLFQNVATADFHLKPGSPAIDAGKDLGILSDYEGTPVPLKPDIGAYEFNPSATSRLIIGGEGIPLSCSLPMPDSFAYATITDLPAWATATYDPATRLLTLSGTPTASGDATSQLKRADDTTALEIRFHILGGFAEWQENNFNTEDLAKPEISGPAAAPGGLANLMRFAMGLRATDPLPAFSSISPESQLSLTYTRDRFADTSPFVEVSSDMLTWKSGPAFTEDIARVPNDDGTETVTTRDLTPRPAAIARFIRLRADR